MPRFVPGAHRGKLFGPKTPGGALSPPSLANKRVILLAGQSNMAGRGLAANITTDSLKQLSGTLSQMELWQIEHSNDGVPVTFYDDVGPLQPRSVSALSQSNLQDFGPEAGLGRLVEAVAPGEFAIAKYSAGGTDAQTYWAPSGSYPPSPPNLFNRLINFGLAAEQRFGGAVSCLVWMQGETDGNSAVAAANYEANLGAIFAGVRGRWPGLPIVFTRLSVNNTTTSGSQVRYGQSQHYLSSSLTTMVTTDECTLTDGVHFTANELALMGVKVGRAALNHLGYHIPLTSSFTVVKSNLTGTFTYVPVTANHTGSRGLPQVSGVTAWSWDFGDGQVTGGIGPHTHVYSTNGIYTASLGIVDYSGISVTGSQGLVFSVPTWAVDSTAGKGVPASAYEWNQMIASQSLTNWAAPASLYLCQETTGALADSIGGRNLAVTATPLYGLSEVGWTRKFVGPNLGSATNTQFSTNTFPILSGTSGLMLGYLTYVSQSADRDQMFYGAAAGNSLQVVGNGGGIARYRNSATANGLLNHTGSVHPFVLRFDRANSVNALYTDIEKISVAFRVGTTGGTVTLNVNSALDARGSTRFCYAAVWTGSFAERTDAEIKSMLTALGWTVTGY